ncbi:MAG: phage holin family protein [Nitrospira sp.]|nr:phage holin family protein [Nitrospira sp.]
MDNPHPISIAALATGLVDDLRRLVSQEIRLAQHEMQLELRKVAKGLLHAALGIILSLVAISLFLVMLVHIVHTYAGMPLWACYGLVAVIAAALGGIFLYNMVNVGSSLRLWPFRTVRSIKEDAQWIKEQLLSTRT